MVARSERILSRQLRLWLLLSAGTVIYFWVNFQRIAVPGAIFNELQWEFQVPAAAITGLGAMFMYIYSINQLFSGLLVDRYGGLRVIQWGGLLFCLGALLFPLSSNIVLLFCSRALIGFGVSGIYLSMVKELTRCFPRHFSVMLGIFMVLGYSGSIAANAPLIYVVHQISWRSAMLGAALCLLVAWVAFVALNRQVASPVVRAGSFSFRPFLEILKLAQNRYLFGFNAANFGVVYCLQTTIGKKFLEDFCRMSSKEAAGYMSIMAIISAFSSLGMALLCQVCGNKRRPFVLVAVVALMVSMGTIWLAVCFGVHTKLLAGFYLLLGATGNLPPITISLMRDNNSEDHLGTAVSFSNFFCYMVLALLCNLVGVMMDLFAPEQVGEHLIYGRGSYLGTFGLMVVVAGWGMFNCLRIREPLPRGR